MLDTVRLEVRHAARSLRRTPVFSAVAVLSIALGIGANTAVFSVINALFFRPLPYRDAGRLVDVYEHHPTEVCPGCGVGTSYPAYLELRERAAFADAAAYRTAGFTVANVGGAERWRGAYATASLFPLLGIDPLYGRTFTAEEDAAGGGGVVVIGERLWRARFAGTDAIGRVVRVNGQPHTIVGVMPDALAFPPFSDLWVPLAPVAAADGRDDRTIGTVARLAEDVTIDAARAEIAGVAARLEVAYPATNAGWTGHVAPLRAELAADYAPSFLLMLGIVGVVLLVACANLANLLLARASMRRQELAVRAALGASRAVLARHLLTESLLVSITGGILSLVIATWALEGLALLPRDALPSWVRYDIDARVALFAAALAVGTGIVFGLLPALQAARTNVSRMLTEGARGSTGGPARTRVRNILVTVQIAAAMVLVSGAAFFTSEFLRIADYDAGYDMDGVYGGRITLASGSADPREVAAIAHELTTRIAVAAGTRDVALSSMYVPNWPGTPRTELRVQDRAHADVADALHRVHNITPAYFRALGTTLLAGREFTDADRADATPVAIVGQALAARLWPGQNPLGRQLHPGGPDDDWVTIVGVAPSRRTSPFARDTARLLYLPMAQHASSQPQSDQLSLHLLAPRAPAGLPLRIRNAGAAVQPDAVVEDVRSAREEHQQWTAPVRLTAAAAAGLGFFAVLLAAMGLYGLIAFAVAQRTAEIGIRIALGSTRAGIIRMVVRQAAILAAIGLAFGTLGALGLGAVLRSQFANTRTTAPLTTAALVLAFLGIAALASWIPARRASRIDPIAALRAD